jgi:hypothetical protein
MATDFSTGTIRVSLNYTLQLSHIKSSLHTSNLATNFFPRSLPYRILNSIIAPSLLNLPCRTQLNSRPRCGLHRKHPVSNSNSIAACVFVAAGKCLPSRCLAINVSSGSTIPAFRRHVTIFLKEIKTEILTQLVLNVEFPLSDCRVI